MPAEPPFRMAVETPHEWMRLIRVVGNLDRAAAASLLRLIDAQLEVATLRDRRLTDLIVDIEGVESFGPGGLETVRHARHCTDARDVRLHLTGCSGRFHLLPLRARRILGEFDTFPTVEVALAELARTAATPPSTAGHPGASAPATPPPTPRHDGHHGLRSPHPATSRAAPNSAGLPRPRQSPEPEAPRAPFPGPGPDTRPPRGAGAPP